MSVNDKTIQIAVHFFDQQEEELVRNALDEIIEEYDGVLVGRVSRQKLQDIVNTGLAVDLEQGIPGLSKADLETTGVRSLSRDLGDDLEKQDREKTEWIQRFRRKARRVAQLGGRRGLSLSEEDKNFDPVIHGFEELSKTPTAEEALEEDVYEVRFKVPINNRIQAELNKLGIEISSFQPPDIYRIFLTPVQFGKLCNLPFINQVNRYDIRQTITPGILESEKKAGEEPEPAVPELRGMPALEEFDLVIHREKDLEKVRAIVEDTEGTEVVDFSARLIRFRCTPGSPLLAALANLPQVMSISPYKPPSLFCDWVRNFVGIARISKPGTLHLTGEGQKIAIFDSGIDDGHPDLQGRIEKMLAVPDAVEKDISGHGSHVAGIIAGTGASSNGSITGMAPQAKLVSVGIVDAAGKFKLPVDLGKLLNKAVEAGAHIINLSWGFSFHGGYVHGSMTVDQFVYDNPDVLVVIAAGNEGKAPRGFHELKTIGAPATAKNVLTVGACGVGRPQFQGKKWGIIDPRDFPIPPASQETLQPDQVAAPSSRGPTDYDSIKPDLVVPGFHILSTRANDAPRDLFQEIYPKFAGRYAFLGGTSMATPVVSGAAALVRQYLQRELGIAKPSAALLKAILIAAAVRLPPRTQPEGFARKIGYPDFDNGFGLMALDSIFPGDGNSEENKLSIIDVANDSAEALASRMPSGSERHSKCSYEIRKEYSDSTPIRIVMTWTDVPGTGVQNNLGLEVKKPDGTYLRGNGDHVYLRDPMFEELISGTAQQFDKRNNVEHILIEDPPSGTYQVRVRALNTPFPPQGYSICISGAELLAE